MDIVYTICYYNKDYNDKLNIRDTHLSHIRWDSPIFIDKNKLLSEINNILNIFDDNKYIKEKWDINKINNLDKIEYILYDIDFDIAYWVEKSYLY